MPSPFPGMSPYLEQDDTWQDFHDRLIPVISELLSPQLSPHFIVKIEEHIYVHQPAEEKRGCLGSADVGVVRSAAPGGVETGVAVLEPPETVLLSAGLETEKQIFLEIRAREGRELVTVIEVLSPSNKRAGSDREQYLAKRWTLLQRDVHFVEIDLLRGRPRMPYEDASACDYCVLVSKAEQRPKAGYWPIALRDRLAIVPIPLRPPLGEVRLDLQQALHLVYDRAYYKDYIYQGTPQPPLSGADEAWARSILQS